MKPFNKKVLGMLLAVLLAVTMLAGCGNKQVAENEQATNEQTTYEWKLQNTFGPGDQTYDVQMPMIVDAIQKATDNRIKITTYIPGAISEPEQVPESVAKGMIECAISSPGYCGQLIPAAYAEQGIPFYWESGQDVYDTFYDYGMLDYLRTEYDKVGLYFGMYVPNGAYSLMTTFPVNSTADLKGKKIRASSSYGEFVKQLGASPVTMSGGDIYMGLKLGTIDGCVYSISELESAKLKEVLSDIMVQPACGSAPVNFIISKKVWEELPADLQDAVNAALQEAFMPIYEASVALDDPAIAAAKEYGVHFNEVSAENMNAFWEAGIKTADYVVKNYPEAEAGIDIIKKWHEENK